MTVKTEAKHAEEFLLREGNGDISREAGTVASGQTLVDGQAVMFSAGKLVAAAGAHDTEGDTTEDIAGIICGNWDVDADTTGVPYIARLATVKDSAITYHTGGADAAKKAAVKAALLAALIVQR